MVNTDKLRGKMVENRVTSDMVADAIKCSRSTVYRKIRDGGDDFTVGEVTIIASMLHLTTPEINDIFFAE